MVMPPSRAPAWSCPLPKVRSRRCCSALKTTPHAIVISSAPAACPACCRPAPIASPTLRMMRAWPHSASRSAASELAERHGAQFKSIVGDELTQQNFPLIHAVGMASPRAPRLIELNWGDAAHPKVTLVGKGVCFDTGGLELKPSSGMLLMKKDMGGAAYVLALALMVMDAGLKLRLRVLIAAGENAVAGNAFRPLDVFPSRKGITVEIGNTGAEGRLILADALALADEENPGLLIDMGTLTGAARVALGPNQPPFYTQGGGLAAGGARGAGAGRGPRGRGPRGAPDEAW